jgi:hypothetical protein
VIKKKQWRNKMALETLKDVKEIGGFKVLDIDNLQSYHTECFSNLSGKMSWEYFDANVKPNYPIVIHHDRNIISFTIQNGPIKEVGINGCQVDTIIEAAKLIITGLNNKFPCTENHLAIANLDAALFMLNKRKQDRINREVEGLNKE